MTDQPFISFDDVRAEVVPSRLPALLRDILPGGKVSGGYYMVSSPHRPDKNPSMWVALNTGAWCDEGASDRSDLFGLIIYVMGTRDRLAAKDWLMDWAGLRSGIDRRQLEARREQAVQHERRVSRDAEAKAARNVNRAKALFFNAVEDVHGTPVDSYLRHRGITIQEFLRRPGAIRYLPDARHIDADGVISEWPCMIAAMSAPDGQVRAVHRTWLARDGRGKAPVRPAKKIWPSFTACVIRISKGAGNKSPEDAARRGLSAPCIVCEGIEDGLSLALATPELRVWAAGSLGNLVNVPDHPCVNAWIVARDNDEGKPQAQAQFAKALQHFRATGKPVREIASTLGKDFNDQLKGEKA